jgi:hypothetical protein
MLKKPEHVTRAPDGRLAWDTILRRPRPLGAWGWGTGRGRRAACSTKSARLEVFGYYVGPTCQLCRGSDIAHIFFCRTISLFGIFLPSISANRDGYRLAICLSLKSCRRASKRRMVHFAQDNRTQDIWKYSLIQRSSSILPEYCAPDHTIVLLDPGFGLAGVPDRSSTLGVGVRLQRVYSNKSRVVVADTIPQSL